MNLRDLKYFVAVAEYKHFGRAAAACFVSQPTLSAQLKKLEETLGVSLFERDNKHVMLTLVGEECLAAAKSVLTEVGRLTHIAKHAQDPLAGACRLGVIPTIAPYLLPKITPHLVSALPNVTLLYEEWQTEALLQRLAEGQLDAGIIALPIPAHAMETYPLFDEPFVLAMPEQHVLAQSNAVAISALTHHPVLLLEEGHCLRDQTLAFCEHLQVQARQDFRATSLETLRQMVIAKVGITVLPQMAALPYAGLTYRHFAGVQPHRQIVLIFRPTSARKVLLQKMAALIAAQEVV